MQWYVANVTFDKEYVAQAMLKSRIKQENLQSDMPHIILPTDSKNKFLFPGYMFINMNPTNAAISLVKNTLYISNFVGTNNEPVPLEKEEIKKILTEMLKHD